MRTLLENDKFFDLLKSSYFGKNYSERQLYFLQLHKSYSKELEYLVSLYYTFKPYSVNYLSFLRQNLQEQVIYVNFFDYLRDIIYLLETGNYKEILNVNKQAPNNFIFAIKYFLKGDFLNTNEDFVFSLLSTVYPRDELYSILKINKPISIAKLTNIYGKATQHLEYPLIYYKKPKGNYIYVTFIKNLNSSSLTIKNKALENYLLSMVKYPVFILGFLYDKKEKVIVPLFFSKDLTTISEITGDYIFDVWKLKVYPNIRKVAPFSFKKPVVKRFSLESEIKENAHLFLKEHYILMKSGLFNLQFKEKSTYVKVSDYYFVDYIISGVILDNNVVLKTKVPDDIIVKGISNLYVRKKSYYYNDEVFYESYEHFKKGEFRKCVCCGEFFTKSSHTHLCQFCYKQLYNKVLYRTDNFELNLPFIKDDFETYVEKYRVEGEKGKAKFYLDLSHLPKGYQPYLPFNNP